MATLIRQVGDFDLGRRGGPGAFAAAVDQWRSPACPIRRAWIIQTAPAQGHRPHPPQG
ncbi:MAG: hypothetical protein U0793_34030 [Gemmataceae bacterium]